MLKSVVDPIRAEILERPPPSDMADLEVGEEVTVNKLKMLITLLCDKDPSCENLPHPLETICQIIVMQTKKFSRPSKNKLKTPDKQRRVMKSNEVPLIRLTTSKLYSKIRSKDLINDHFNKGMALSYNRVMDFTRDVSAVMIELFSRSEEHALSSAVRTGLFTVFAVDNVDKNASSVSAQKHFYGTSGTVLQYPTTANPGGVRMKKKFHDLTANEKKATYSRALDTFLTVDESITIRTKEIYSPILTVNYDEEWEVELSGSFHNGMLIEQNWSAKVSDQIKSSNVQLDEDGWKLGWTAFHTSRQSGLVTSEVQEAINSMLPVNEHVAHTAALQYHYMSAVRNYTSYINPGQTTVLCADQPLYALQKSISWAYAAQFIKEDSQVMDILPFFGPIFGPISSAALGNL